MPVAPETDIIILAPGIRLKRPDAFCFSQLLPISEFNLIEENTPSSLNPMERPTHALTQQRKAEDDSITPSLAR